MNNCSINNRLEIILITYNRKEYLAETLKLLFETTSPIQDNYDITILDNCSTDGSSELIDEYCKEHKRLKHIRHNKNIGGNANIVEAMKLVQKEYVWFLCDDDSYQWDNWYKVLEAIENKDDVIMVEYNYPSSNIPIEIIPNELGFLPAAIYRSELITSDVIQNAYVNIYNSLPHLALVCDIFNKNKKITILNKPIVIQGWECKTEYEYTRGFEDTIHPKQLHTNLFLGYVNSFKMLNDNKFRYKCCSNLWIGKSFIYSVNVFLEGNNWYIPNIISFFLAVSDIQKIQVLYCILIYFFKKFIRQIFEITNNNTHKRITILGIKINIKRKKHS